MSTVRHIVSWRKRDDLAQSDWLTQAADIKRDLEALVGVIDGLLDMAVAIDPLATSNVDLLLDSRFSSAEALAAYQQHPAHKTVGARINTATQDRHCLDYII